MNAVLVPIVVCVIALLPALLSGLYIRWLRKKEEAKGRSSLSKKLMRGPAHAVETRLQEISDEIDERLMLFMVIPSMMALAYVIAIHYFAMPDSWFLRGGVLVGAIIVIGREWRKLIPKVRLRWRLRLARDAEAMIGQELNMLMQQGAWVCHDFPGEGFNIDHVVVTPQGVLAVETKSRLKPQGMGKEGARVKFDGKTLHFPHRTETAPVEQAIRQSEWLATWLRSATGDNVAVLPVVALPGWFIERTVGSRHYVQLTNGSEANYLMKSFGQTSELPKDQRQRILHQLEQRCRDVEPFMYRKNEWAV